MDLERIRALYDFNRWANHRVLEVMEKLSSEEFTKDLKNSFPSVRDTLVHIMAAEWIWLERWRGTSPKALLDASEFPTVPAIRTRWVKVERQQRDFISGITEESLKRVVAYINLRGEPYKYPLWQMLQHLVNHSSYHRGQITTMLRQLGAQPVASDFLVYYDMIAK
ncbi:MAG: DinB family protein [candidate division Zixibacteria bacterium]|nr:DinB family protein [candidate division Zixibacteria bacterium]